MGPTTEVSNDRKGEAFHQGLLFRGRFVVPVSLLNTQKQEHGRLQVWEAIKITPPPKKNHPPSCGFKLLSSDHLFLLVYNLHSYLFEVCRDPSPSIFVVEKPILDPPFFFWKWNAKVPKFCCKDGAASAVFLDNKENRAKLKVDLGGTKTKGQDMNPHI